MANPYNGSKLGKRGNNPLRPSREPLKETHGTCQTAIICQRGTLIDSADVEEQIADDVIPPETMAKLVRKPLTSKLGLKLFPVDREYEDCPVIIVDPKTGLGKKVIQRSRVVWKSDNTLLTKGAPTVPLERIRFTRVTSQTKRRVYEPEQPATVEIPVEPALDYYLPDLDDE